MLAKQYLPKLFIVAVHLHTFGLHASVVLAYDL